MALETCSLKEIDFAYHMTGMRGTAGLKGLRVRVEAEASEPKTTSERKQPTMPRPERATTIAAMKPLPNALLHREALSTCKLWGVTCPEALPEPRIVCSLRLASSW